MIICCSTPQALQQLFSLQLFSFIQKTFSPTPNLKRGQGLCILYERLQMRDNKVISILYDTLFHFYITILFAEL